ncbi:hypothetical protein EV1_012395 [Malus domestica]
MHICVAWQEDSKEVNYSTAAVDSNNSATPRRWSENRHDEKSYNNHHQNCHEIKIAYQANVSEVVENLVAIEKLTEDLKKAKHMTELEIEEKNKISVDLDKETSGLRKSMAKSGGSHVY